VTRAFLTASELQTRLGTLLGMVDRFAPTHAHDPERWHSEKSALRDFVLALIEETGGSAATARSFCAQQRDTGIAAICSKGRIIPIQRRRIATDKQI
jgi:hypothetical protein